MTNRSRHPGFTLIELVLVMFVIALIAGILAPALFRFTEGRIVDNFGRQMVGLCQLARMKSTNEAQAYYIVFSAKQITLTTVAPGEQAPAANQNPSQSAAPPPTEVSVPQGLNVSAGYSAAMGGQPVPRMITLLPWDPNLNPQPQPLQRELQLLDGTSGGSETLWTLAPDTSYIQFGPTGITDPMTIHVSDNSGHSVEIACDSPTENFHVVENAR